MLTIDHPITGDAHILLPHNGWSRGTVPWKRRWQTGISMSPKGNEKRLAMRDQARQEITFYLIAASLQERARLNARVDQATKSGIACAPFFGRGFTLAETVNAGSDTITLNANPTWTWQPNDFAIFIADDLTFDCIQVQDVADNVLTLAENLTNGWLAPSLCWPLIFGAFSADPESALSGHLGAIKITIAEMVSARSAQLGITPGQGGPAIPDQQVEQSNEVL